MGAWVENLHWMSWLAVARLTAQWRSLLTVIVGVLLAAVVGANIPLYTSAIAQVGMVERLNAVPQERVHLYSRVSQSGGAVQNLDADWSSTDTEVRALVSSAFSAFQGWVDSVVTWGETTSLIPVHAGADIPNLKLRVAYYDDWESHVELVAGTLPAEPAEAEIDLEAVMDVELAAALNVEVGDVLILDQRGWETSIPIRTKITGLVLVPDSSAPYFMSPSPLRVDVAGERSESNLLTTRSSMIRIAQHFVPQTTTVIGWRILFDHASQPFSAVEQAAARLDDFEGELTGLLQTNLSQRPTYHTNLSETLRAYVGEVTLLNVPFALLLLQIAALVLFFLVVIIALVRRGERREIALLQSRGALDAQVIGLRAVEALFICAGAVLAAPFIARQILVWVTPIFTTSERLTLVIGADAFLFAGITSALALLMLVGTIRPVLHLPLIQAGGSAARSEKQVWWQRAYLDVILVVIGGVALVRLIGTETPLARTVSGGLQADPILLLAPSLLFVALGSLSLRLFPAVGEAGARWFALRRGLLGALATWQVSREPTHYGRVTFLLALAIGVGWFATSFQATIFRSQEDQARYRVGTDIVFNERDTAARLNRVRPIETYLAHEGIEAGSTATRYRDVNLSLSGTTIDHGQILAVDPETFAQVAYWRDDLGALPLPQQPMPQSETGALLPLAPSRIGIWVRAEQSVVLNPFSSNPVEAINGLPFVLNNLLLYVRLRDDESTFIEVPLTAREIEGFSPTDSLDSLTDPNIPNTATSAEAEVLLREFAERLNALSGWVYFEGSIPATLSGIPHFETIYWRAAQTNARFQPVSLSLSLSGLTLHDAAGQVIESVLLTQIDQWALVPEFEGTFEGEIAAATFENRPPGITTIWRQFNERVVMGVFYNYPEPPPLPAIVSRSFAEHNNLTLGAPFTLFFQRNNTPFVVQNIVDYFPTLFDRQQPFVVMDRDSLFYALNRRPNQGAYPNEVWLKLLPGVSSADLLSDLRLEAAGADRLLENALTAEEVQAELTTDPLFVGLIGLLFVAFGVAMTLSAVSLFTYTALTAAARRGEFAVLRALGLRMRGVVMAVVLEQAVVLIIAVALGIGLGVLLSDRVLPTLAIGMAGQGVTPPFRVQFEGGAMVAYAVLLVGLLAAISLVNLLLIRRMSLTQTLRYGEE
jgi:hypothetical protein